MNDAEPSLAWKIISGVIVLLFAIAVWGFVEWRSAPPPPPEVKLPWE
jgi:hypothetical protein